MAEIIYTSGTTGRPKGAMLSHKNLYSSASVIGEDMQLSQVERTLIVTPLFHIAPQSSFLNCTLIYGGTCYLKERWTNADDILETLQSLRITCFFAVPTMYAFMLDSPKLTGCDLSALRVPFTGGASLPVEILKKWKEITGAEIVEGYGLSETSSGCTRNLLNGIKKPGSAGIAYPGMYVKIFDEQERELPSGQVGEIVVRGPNVMLGYWNNPEATDQALRNQWLHTGDLAYKDEDDYLFIVDRKKDMIIRGGLNIYCGSDLHILHGLLRVEPGTVIGHEFVGVVEEVGSAVTKFKPGDRVLSMAAVNCGRCRACRNRLVFACENGGAYGCGPKMGNLQGVQVEYARVLYADENLEKIPEGLTDEQVLFVGDILATAYTGVVGVNPDGKGIQPGSVVAIFGSGPVGLCAGAVARLFSTS